MSTASPRQASAFQVLAITVIAGFASIVFAVPGFQHWYPTLVKPSFTPPTWTLLPVTVLCTLLLGWAAGIIAALKPPTRSGVIALRWHWSMIGLSFLWITSFSGRWLDIAYFSVLGVWIAVLGCLWTFSKLSGRAAWLLLPYLVWVTYASTVNFNILVEFQRPLIEKMDEDPANQDEPSSGLTHRADQPEPTATSAKTQ